MRSYWYPDAVSTRTVFWAYAALACVGGERWAKVALTRVFGTMLVGAGLVAIAFAKVEDLSSRRRGLAYFAAAHGVICLMSYLQVRGPWGAGLGEQAAKVLLAVTTVLFWFWFSADWGLGWRAICTIPSSSRSSSSRPPPLR
jgi:hypothetical protein